MEDVLKTGLIAQYMLLEDNKPNIKPVVKKRMEVKMVEDLSKILQLPNLLLFKHVSFMIGARTTKSQGSHVSLRLNH